MTKNISFLSIESGSNNEKRLILPCMTCKPGNGDFLIPCLKQTYFPVWMCFTVTTNNAQGQSFSGAIEVDLKREFFSMDRCTWQYQQLHSGHTSIYLQIAKTTKHLMWFTNPYWPQIKNWYVRFGLLLREFQQRFLCQCNAYLENH